MLPGPKWTLFFWLELQVRGSTSLEACCHVSFYLLRMSFWCRMKSMFLENNGHDESVCNSVASATNPVCWRVVGTKSGQSSCARSAQINMPPALFCSYFLTLILTMKSFVAGTLLQDRIAPARHGFFMPDDKTCCLEKSSCLRVTSKWLRCQQSSAAAKEW
jgi:hypothetical protein